MRYRYRWAYRLLRRAVRVRCGPVQDYWGRTGFPPWRWYRHGDVAYRVEPATGSGSDALVLIHEGQGSRRDYRLMVPAAEVTREAVEALVAAEQWAERLLTAKPTDIPRLRQERARDIGFYLLA